MEALILSYALDTNGQNARYVQAARKHGDDVLRSVAIGNADPGGVVGRLQEAATKSDWLRIRSAHRATAYFDFPTDIIWTRRTEQMIRTLIMAADVIHLNNSEMAYKHFSIRKPALLHHHGSLFRNDPERMLYKAKQYRMQQAVSTIDLQKPAPDLLPWLPTAYDIDSLQVFAAEHRREPDGRVRIVHAPTNRTLKHTDLFLEAVRQLTEEGLPIDLDLIEGQTWAETMKRKAQADIVFDQLAFGYGCNAVEAWGMGIPVIAGAEDPWVIQRMSDLWGYVPFYEAGAASLKASVKRMVESADLRARAAEEGLNHVRTYHDEKPALAILADLYEQAIRRYHRVRIPGKAPNPATFKQAGARKVYLEGETIPFKDGQLTTDDPYLIDRLRHLARRRAFGIEEVA